MQLKSCCKGGATAISGPTSMPPTYAIANPGSAPGTMLSAITFAYVTSSQQELS